MIYFVQSAHGPIKIGMTTNLDKRLVQLRSANKGSLSVLGLMPGGGKTEAALHVEFADIRLDGEWFAPHERLLRFVSDRATPYRSETSALERERTASATASCALLELGARIRRARIRRKLTSEMMAQRCGMSRPTYRAVERGEPGVSVGRLAAVLEELGLLGDIGEVANRDAPGRGITDAELLLRSRVRVR